jgi:UDP-2,3-diacylglucosamine hydrolase
MASLAIIAGQGHLPGLVARDSGRDCIFVLLEGVEAEIPAGVPVIHATFERLGEMFSAMKSAGVDQVVFCGGMARPELDPAKLDAFTVEAMPKLMAGFARGDDFLLQVIIELFESQGFSIVGAHELVTDLTLAPGCYSHKSPSESELDDARRGKEILNVISPLDLGQGCAVASGLCLGIETLQGTDALLDFVAKTAPYLRRSAGVFVKTAKTGQDLRIDMPTIGPETVVAVQRAGLAGIAVSSHKVMVIQREATVDAINAAGLFLVAL